MARDPLRVDADFDFGEKAKGKKEQSSIIVEEAMVHVGRSDRKFQSGRRGLRAQCRKGQQKKSNRGGGEKRELCAIIKKGEVELIKLFTPR